MTFYNLCLFSSRYNTGTSVVIHRGKTVKHGGRELQLPSMSLLTNKNSSQQFLLRILKVVIQLRDAARQASRRPKRGGNYLEIKIVSWKCGLGLF